MTVINPKTWLALFLFILGSTLLVGTDILCPDYAVPGEGLSLFIRTNQDFDYTGGEVTLSLSGGKALSRSRFFLLPLEEGSSEKIWCSLLGIPSYLEEDSYTLICRMESEEGTELFQKRLGVSVKEFDTQTLELTKTLSNLRTQEDPLKVSQAQRLWSILASFNEESVYHFDEFVLPLEAHRTTTSYGARRVYLYDDGTESKTIHNGVDWAAPTGTPVKAVGAGRIVLAEERIVTGKTVILELLPGVFMLYYHLDEITVDEGEMVEPGQQVGALGMTGLATGPHLHWELRISKVAVDPLPFFDARLIDKTLYLTKMMNTL